MKLKRLIAENVYSFDKIDVQLDKYPLVQVTGKNEDEERKILTDEQSDSEHFVNGIGKTNIYNCILQALYSRDIYKTKKQYLKNLYAKGKFSITLYVDDLKIVYSSDDCILYKDNDVFLTGRKAVTEYFEKLIPFDLFLHLTYISSSIVFPFFTATPKQKTEFIELVFSDLNKFKQSIPKLREKLTQVQKDKQKAENNIDLYKTQIAELPGEELPVPEIQEVSFVLELNNWRNIINTLETNKEEYERLLKRLEQIGEIQEVTENLDELSERIGKGKGLIDLTTKEINALKKINYKVCPTCGAELDFKTTANLIQEKEEYKARLTEQYKKLVNKLKKLKEQKEKARVYNDVKSKLTDVKFSGAELTEATAQLEKIQEKQEKEQERLKKQKEERDKIIKHNSKVAQKTDLETKLAQAQEELNAQELLHTKITLLLNICETVIVGKQIPKRLEILEKFINIELANFTSQFTVKLEMDSKIKPKVLKNKKVYPFENLSTGEKLRINISLIFAIRTILQKLGKEVYNINLLYIDEVLGVLDFAGKHLLLESLQRYNLNIFLVSHDFIFPDVQLLQLVKKGNKTNVQ